MKTLVLILFPFLLSAQSDVLVLLFSNGIIYNGTELITNTIDRGMEIGDELVINGDMSATTGYFINAGWDINSTVAGKAYYNDVTDNSYMKRTDCSIVSGNRYLLSFLLSNNNGLRTNLTGSGGENIGAAGLFSVGNITGEITYKYYFNATTNNNGFRFYGYTVSGGTVEVDDLSIKQMSGYTTNGNHLFDSSSTYKQSGTYSGKIVATDAGNGTTNTISLASTLFTAVTNGTNYRFQVYAYTSTANTTLTFKLGDIVKTAIVPTTGMSVLNFDFKATASTTGNILLYLDKAATVYIDEVSLKSGQ